MKLLKPINIWQRYARWFAVGSLLSIIVSVSAVRWWPDLESLPRGLVPTIQGYPRNLSDLLVLQGILLLVIAAILQMYAHVVAFRDQPTHRFWLWLAEQTTSLALLAATIGPASITRSWPLAFSLAIGGVVVCFAGFTYIEVLRGRLELTSATSDKVKPPLA
jgi:hypothetical protein